MRGNFISVFLYYITPDTFFQINCHRYPFLSIHANRKKCNRRMPDYIITMVDNIAQSRIKTLTEKTRSFTKRTKLPFILFLIKISTLFFHRFPQAIRYTSCVSSAKSFSLSENRRNNLLVTLIYYLLKWYTNVGKIPHFGGKRC